MNLICIGVDPDVISYILLRPESAIINVDVCKSVSDAKEKIALSSYDLYIIDLRISESAAFSLIEEIHQKGAIALILEGDPSESYVRMLREDKKITYILERPLLQQQISLMLKGMVASKSIMKKPEHKSKMAELKQMYDASIDEKISRLRELVKEAHHNPEFIKDLKVAIHKISGSAGSFGYDSVSEICKAMEIEVNHRIVDGSYTDLDWIATLDGFVNNVKQKFRISTYEESQLALPHSVITKPLLFVVDDDINFLELLERVKEAFSMDLVVEFDPKKAIERLQSQDIKPHAIIASQAFRSSPLTGWDIFGANNMAPKPIKALLLEQDSIDNRVEAMQKGADYIFSKPTSAYVLLKSMAEALEVKPLGALKVLVVDDDEDFCNYISAALDEIGITTCSITDATDLFNKLEEFHPNILLLDILLPKYDGLHLLKTLRRDFGYKNLIIVLVTSSEKVDTRISAYAENADDILFKPIDRKVVQQRILSIADRRSIGASENYTGLLHLPELKEELTEALKTSRSSYLVLFEVHKFADWLKHNGYSAARDLIILISNQLQWETDSKMKCFWYQSSVFAIVFEEMELDVIEKKMYSLLSQLVQSKMQWNLSFDCSIVPITKTYVTAGRVLQEAEGTLVEASKQAAAPVKIAHRLPKDEKGVKREVVIVDPSLDLLKILRQAFESQGLVVSTFHEGGEALQELLARPESHLPSLIIVERKLADMDGIDMYVKLKTRFKTQIPCFILTVFSADKDISEGIKQGVLEYIVKPFNITILVQKALQVIFKT